VSATVRQATRADVPAMHRVRLLVRENRLTSGRITEADYAPAIETTGRGWVAEQDGRIVGFAVGDARDGNIWALFVEPGCERRGHGRRLHDAMVAWLFARGLERLWLGTEPGTRAERFYRAAGWRFVRRLENGEALYELRPAQAVSAGGPAR
jgi:ribosomal protein S18 acetylase RimI-like enzyme